MGRGGARPGGGKRKGQWDRATLEAELAAAKQQLAQVESRQQKGHKLAVEVLNDVMHVAYGMMAACQPLAPGETLVPGRKPDPAEFKEWMRITVDTAKELAPFQSAKFKSVTHHLETPIGGKVPENPNAEPVQAVSPAEAYRRLRDHDIIDLTATAVVDKPPAGVAKLPAPKKQANSKG